MSSDDSPLDVVSSGAILFFIGKGISNLAGFGLQLILSRSLGAGGFGVYSYARTLLSIVGVFARLGVTESVMRFVPEFEEDTHKRNKYLSIAFSTSVVGSIVGAVLLFSFSDVISSLTLDTPLLSGVLKIFAIFLPIQVLTQAISNTFRAFERADYHIFIRDVLIPVLNVISVAVAIFLGATIIGVSATIVFSGGIVLLLSIVLLFKKIDVGINISLDKREAYEYYNFSVPLTLTAAGSLLYTQVDRLMVGYFLGDVEVGVYSIAIALATVTGLALTGLNQLFPPIASKLYAQSNRAELQKTFSTVTRWGFTVCLLPATYLIAFRSDVLSIFGSEFIQGAPVMLLFVVAQVTRSVVGPSGYMLMMSNHQYVVLFNRWFLGISNVVVNYILITRYGFIGAAIASALTLGVVNVFRLLELWVLERYMPYTKQFYKPILGSSLTLISFVLFASFTQSMQIPTIAKLILGGIVGFCVYALSLYSLGISEIDRKTYSKIRS